MNSSDAPAGGYIASVFFILVVGVYGYATFDPFDAEAFFGCYGMTILAIILFVGWKSIKRTSFKDSHQVDLVWERPAIDAYEVCTTDALNSFWGEMSDLIFFRRRKISNEESRQ